MATDVLHTCRRHWYETCEREISLIPLPENAMVTHIPHEPVRRPDHRPDQSPDHNKERGDQPARDLPDKHPVPPSTRHGEHRRARRW